MTYTALFTQLVRAEIELWNSLDRRLLDRLGVTLPTYQALSAIAVLEHPVRVQDVSVEMSITVGATSKVVDRLEGAGLVVREDNPDDRRSSLILLTDAGRKTLTQATNVAERHLEGLLTAKYSKAQAAKLASELSALRGLTANGAR